MVIHRISHVEYTRGPDLGRIRLLRSSIQTYPTLVRLLKKPSLEEPKDLAIRAQLTGSTLDRRFQRDPEYVTRGGRYRDPLDCNIQLKVHKVFFLFAL